jgi:hypothetical protein
MAPARKRAAAADLKRHKACAEIVEAVVEEVQKLEVSQIAQRRDAA